MKKTTTVFNSIKSLKGLFLILSIISTSYTSAQCVGDVDAPIPDVASLPEVKAICSAQLTRPTAFDECENRAVSGTVAGNKLTYSVGTYTVTWTYKDASNNSSTQTQKVTVAAVPTPTITLNRAATICKGDSVRLSWTQPLPTNPSVTYSGVEWNTGATTSTNNSIWVKTAGTYTLTVFTDNGCAVSNTQAITLDTIVPVVPTITAKGALSFCEGKKVTLKSSSKILNTWSNDSHLDSLVVTTSGKYTVTVSNTCGSKTSAPTVIDVKPLLPMVTVVPNDTVCPGDSVLLISNSTTGNTWAGVAFWESATNDTLVAYINSNRTFTLTINNGCAVNKSVKQKIVAKSRPAAPTMDPFYDKVCNDPNDIFGVFNTYPLPAGYPEGGTYSGSGVISFGNTNVFSPTAASLVGIGSIVYTVTDSLTGCTNSVSQMVFIDTTAECTMGINENVLATSTSIFPNPSSGKVTITVNNVAYSTIQIAVADVLGNTVLQTIAERNTGGFTRELNLNNLAKGVYVIQLSADGERFSKKIIIE